MRVSQPPAWIVVFCQPEQVEVSALLSKNLLKARAAKSEIEFSDFVGAPESYSAAPKPIGLDWIGLVWIGLT